MHTRDGWYFEGQPDGSVRVAKVGPSHGYDIVLTKAEWESVCKEVGTPTIISNPPRLSSQAQVKARKESAQPAPKASTSTNAKASTSSNTSTKPVMPTANTKPVVK